MRIATWNVASIRPRLLHLITWLKQQDMDIVALQEIKTQHETFPFEALQNMGYHCAIAGQKSYNGVAILSKNPAQDIVINNPLYTDGQMRIISATIQTVRIVCVYVPNGESVDTEKYHYKLEWLQALTDWLAQEKMHYANMVILGDFNIAPTHQDVFNIQQWAGKVLCSPLERQAFQNLLALGFIDGFRTLNRDDCCFSWWDYRRGAFAKNNGLRIDHILVSSALASACHTSWIDTTPRTWEKPSDHAPVCLSLNL